MNEQRNFDVVVVCTSTEFQANYWQQRLDNGVGTWLPATTKVVAVHEDWPGGAGNGLGTLYAFKKAVSKGKTLYGIDFQKELTAGSAAIGLYHSAGKGTRLAPLPGGENNNKPGVKLCASVQLRTGMEPITILESVIKQTGCYGVSRKGRLSVFWGDQIFVPTVSVEYTPTHHIDILCKLGPMVDEKEWSEKGLQNYGLIVRRTDKEAAQVEKVDHSTAMKMLNSFGKIDSVGASLGSFSLSHQMLSYLLNEFEYELSRKKGKMDSDPHFWMPLTLERSVYVDVMVTKGSSTDAAGKHFDRMRSLLDTFRKVPSHTKLGVFGAVDVGTNCDWWDYGRITLYRDNASLMMANTDEGERMRSFFNVGQGGSRISQSTVSGVKVDKKSVVLSSDITSGNITSSIVNNVRCLSIDADNCILVNVTARKIKAPSGSIIYNVVDDSEDGIIIEENNVRVGVVSSDSSQLIISSSLSIDGGKAWKQKVMNNTKSFEDVYNMNETANPTSLESIIRKKHDILWSKIGPTQYSLMSTLTNPITIGIAAVVATAAFVLLRRK